MRVLSVYNMKGGVGKTAASVNLGYLASEQGNRTLIWDLDPQAATSFYLRVKPRVKGGAKKIAKGKSDLEELIQNTEYDLLDLLPSDFSYREFDVRLAREKSSHLRHMLAPLAEEYDLVIFDCPPSISELSEQIFRASNLLLVPLVPTTLSLRAMDQLREFLGKGKTRGLAVRSFYSMVDRRKKLHRELVDAPGAGAGIGLRASIPYSSAVERMGIECRPVLHFAPRSAPSQAYRALWEEVAPLIS